MIALYSVLIVLCLLGSSYLSSYETALTWINRHRLKSLAKERSAKGKRAAKVYGLKANFTLSLTVILIWNNLFNIGATTLLNLLFAEVLPGGNIGQAAGIAVGVSTVLIVVFGEIIPKNLAFRYAEKFAVGTVYVLIFFKYLLFPLIWGWSYYTKKRVPKVVATESEVIELLSSSESEGVFEHKEKELVEAAVHIKEKVVSDSMVPWRTVESITIRPSWKDLEKIFHNRYHYSRLPVLNQSKNKVVGFIKMKDVYRNIVINKVHTSGEKFELDKLLFAPLFVHENEHLLDALEILQKKKLHIAVVVSSENSDKDDPKNPLGIITLEDVIEELIGEIYDEHDEILFNEPVTKTGLDRFQIRGDVSFNVVFNNYLTETTKPKGDYRNFHGWVATESKQPIKKGFSWTYENLIITLFKKQGKTIVYEVQETINTISNIDDPLESRKI